jgi:hypothetical protein
LPAASYPAEIDSELCRKWTGRHLSQNQTLQIVCARDPAPFFHQITLHCAGEGDGAPNLRVPRRRK